MKIVLDTNVIVSGLISPYGNPAEIMRMVSVGEIRLCYDARIITEYKEVLRKPKFQFNPEKIDIILDQIQYLGEIVSSKPLMNSLPAPGDNPFLEVALAGNAEYLVTGNINHFPNNLCQVIKIVSPSNFIIEYKKIW